MTNFREEIRRLHYHSALHRAFYSLFLVMTILLIGTLGFHFFEGFSFLDSFYFTTLIATGQGASGNLSPASPAGKIFTCFIAFISVGFMIAALSFLLGPFLGKSLRIGAEKLEEELHLKKHKHK